MRVHGRGGGGGGTHLMHSRVVLIKTIDPRTPAMPGTEHVGFSTTRQISLARSAERRGVFDE